MKEDQLKLLETRINSAIAFIENLKSREKKLLLEREELQKKILSLEKGIEEKDKRNEDLLKIQKYLKEKIEFILGKLEGLAGMYEENPPSSMENASEEKPGTKGASAVKDSPAAKVMPQELRTHGSSGGAHGEAGELIIEENIVDLKEENEKSKSKRAKNHTQGGAGGSRGKQEILKDNEPKRGGDREEGSLFESNNFTRETRYPLEPNGSQDIFTEDLFPSDEKTLRKDGEADNAGSEWYGNNPFVEI